MPLIRPTGDSRRKIIPAVVLIVLVLFSGTGLPTAVFARTQGLSPSLNVEAVTPISKLSLAEWNLPTPSAGPNGVGIDSSGKIWVTENATGKLARFDPSNNNFTEWSLPSASGQPGNIFIKGISISGVNYTQIFFTEYAANAIGRFTVATNNLTEWHLTPGGNPVGIFVDNNNDIWFTESGRDAIGRINTSTNSLTEWTLPGATSTPGSPLLKPWGIYVQVVSPPNAGINRFVWFTESASNMIGRLEATSNRLTLWNLNTIGSSYQPMDITFGSYTSVPSIIFSDAGSNRISILWNDTGGALSTYRDSLVPTANSGPTGLAFDGARSAVWFTEINSARIADLNTTAVLAPVTLTANYCTVAPHAGSPACPSPASMTSVTVTAVTTGLAGSSRIQPPLQTSNLGIAQGPINGYTEYSLPNRTARPRQIALDAVNNLWFTESNATVNRIGRLGIPYVFHVSASPTSRTVNIGGTATYDVTVSLAGGNPLPTQLSLTEIPPNSAASFSPLSGSPTFTSTLSVITTNNTQTGTYNMIVQANSGGQNETAAISLTVQVAPPPPPITFGYTINVNGNRTVSIPQGGSAAFSLSVNLTSGTPESVTLNYSGLPALTTASFTVPSGLPTFSSELDIQTGTDAPAGSYPITITGLSSNGTSEHSAVAPVLVVTELFRDFNLSSSVNQVIVVQGSRIDIPISVTSLGAFDNVVTLDGVFSPKRIGLGASFTPQDVQLMAGETTTATLEIIAYKDTTGAYQVTITGTSSNPTRTHQLVINVNVSPCIIATATFGSELAPEVQFLRNFRDQQMMQTFAGSSFMQVFNAWYYSFSPAVAGYEYSHSTTRFVIKQALYPLMGILHLSSSTYSALGFEPEAAALVAGIVASALIGAAYLALPMTGLLWIERKRISGRTRGRVAKAMAIAFAVALTGFAISELLALSLLMLAASAAIVLTALSAGCILPAFKLVEYAKRRA